MNLENIFPQAEKRSSSSIDEVNCMNKWDREYALQSTIPSSHREKPSHALLEIINRINLPRGKAIDLGCGNGRNAIHLAQRGLDVIGLDFSKNAIKLATEKTNTDSELVTFIKHDIEDGLPIESDSIDVLLDSYCLCHFIDETAYTLAMCEIDRVLKKGGLYLKIHLNDQDLYYRNLSVLEQKNGFISYDPANGIAKQHFNFQKYIHNMSNKYSLVIADNINFIDNVRGDEFNRSVSYAVLKKD